MAEYEKAHWDEWSSRIIDGLGLVKKARDEYHGPCPACGDGEDRFWIKPNQGKVIVNCRVCGDWQTIQQKLHAEGLWPSLQPLSGNVVSIRQEEDFPVQQPGERYHERKGVGLGNAWLSGDVLTVPLYNLDREIAGHQTITPDGQKRFTKGLDKTQGVFGVCGTMMGATHCYIAEGWATSMSVELATNIACVFALDSNNLPLVSEKLQQAFPDIKFTVAADADSAGREAAKKTGLNWSAPKKQGWDWNDVLLAEGPNAVKDGLKHINQPKRLFTKLEYIEVLKPQWLIEGVLEQVSLCNLFGASGTYKTFLGVDIALSIATGLPYHGHNVTQGSVAYVAGEGAFGFARRTGAWFKFHDIDPKGVPFYRSTAPITLDDESIDEICDALDLIQEQSGKLELIVLDTVDRTISGIEDDTGDSKRYLDFMDVLRLRYAATVMAIAHTGHAEPNRVKGSTKWKDRVDSSYQVKAWGQNNVDLICRKMKDAEEMPTMTFLRMPITVETADGEETDSIVLELTVTRTEQGISPQRFREIILETFETQKDGNRMKQADLKALVAIEVDSSQKTVQRRIADMIKEKVFKLDGRYLEEGESYAPF